ncbi:MAG: sulfotransferase family protein [Actinopolymorphaceae bacterium]
MSLRLIGAGWGRTGTVSVRSALAILGYTPHHMSEVFAHPEQAQLFVEAADDPDFEWRRIYADYTATLDWPGCAFWRELADAYPDAKVLLSVRDAAEWFDSYSGTIYRPVAHGWADDPTGAWNVMARRVIVERSFGGEPHDRGHLIDTFRRHNEAVRATIAPERLLVHRVDQGWGPLCEFLGQPVPDEPFPHLNTRGTWA